jgi:hypothetical protein
VEENKMNIKNYVTGALVGFSLLGGDVLASPPANQQGMPEVINKGVTTQTVVHRDRKVFPKGTKERLQNLNTRLQTLEKAGKEHSTEYTALKEQVDGLTELTNTIGTLANTYADRQLSVMNLLSERDRLCSRYDSLKSDYILSLDPSAPTFDIDTLRTELETTYGLNGNLLDDKINEIGLNTKTMTQDEIDAKVDLLYKHFDLLTDLVKGNEDCNKVTAEHKDEKDKIVNARLLRYDHLLNDNIVTLNSKAVEEATEYTANHPEVVNLTVLVTEACGEKQSILEQEYNKSRGFESTLVVNYDAVKADFQAKFPQGEASLKERLEAVKTGTTYEPLPAENAPIAPVDPAEPPAPLPEPVSRPLTPEEIVTLSTALQTEYDASNNLLQGQENCTQAKTNLYRAKNGIHGHQVMVVLERYGRLLALDPDTLTPTALDARIQAALPEDPTNSVALYAGLRVNPNEADSTALNGVFGVEGKIGLGKGISLVLDGTYFAGENIPGARSRSQDPTDARNLDHGFYSESDTTNLETVEIEDYAKLGVAGEWAYKNGSFFRGTIGLGVDLNLGEKTTVNTSETEFVIYDANDVAVDKNNSDSSSETESTVSYSIVPNVSTGVDFKLGKGFYLGLAAKLGYNTNTENVEFTTNLKAGIDF